MNNTPTPPASLSGPGFVTLILDIPIGLGLPNGGYTTFDPLKDMALIQPVLKEGSRSFFRNTPISGPTSFADLMSKARTFERPREDYSYLLTSELADGTQKATLNIHCGKDGGFAEAKYYSEIQITFLEDNLEMIGTMQNYVLQRATSPNRCILSAFGHASSQMIPIFAPPHYLGKTGTESKSEKRQSQLEGAISGAC